MQEDPSPGVSKRKSTYNNSHSHELRRRHDSEQTAQDPPPGLALHPPARDDEEEPHQRGQLGDGGEAHQEPRGAPHGAEVPPAALALGLVREVSARRVRDRTAAPVQADVAREDGAAGRVRAVGDPVGCGDGGECHCRCCDWGQCLLVDHMVVGLDWGVSDWGKHGGDGSHRAAEVEAYARPGNHFGWLILVLMFVLMFVLMHRDGLSIRHHRGLACCGAAMTYGR